MKISTKGRYGLRSMVDLAVNSNGEYVSLKLIAQRQGISENYLEQVFSTLRKAGLVKSIRGSQGGYTLASTPKEITVGEVLRALEGDLCITGDIDLPEEIDQTVENCINSTVWQKVNESINKVVDSITLEDIAEDHRIKTSNYFFDYII
ncbi:transcriptional regulator, BadM/Rrf2 family [Clostridium cavendishii DSM 21758]|uniref:Transcriptional regulator, BadM/Rrf2 family n=1 Tax=Clostridium cavendishii DSM 21758 TaxID=1121302 RepID=A0A1M6FBM8_9CLOT|nr:Rrf2 family transcriptional regulator [Clostridium cavendishii]SHI95075.1 transcriptional regulator, BadM/Rrf2 family [Clostridium cavendishii DSM 21758]